MILCTICGLTAHGTDDICTDCWYKNFSGAQYDTRQPSPLIVAIRTAQDRRAGLSGPGSTDTAHSSRLPPVRPRSR
jgi:hypothetical protein